MMVYSRQSTKDTTVSTIDASTNHNNTTPPSSSLAALPMQDVDIDVEDGALDESQEVDLSGVGLEDPPSPSPTPTTTTGRLGFSLSIPASISAAAAALRASYLDDETSSEEENDDDVKNDNNNSRSDEKRTNHPMNLFPVSTSSHSDPQEVLQTSTGTGVAAWRSGDTLTTTADDIPDDLLSADKDNSEVNTNPELDSSQKKDAATSFIERMTPSPRATVTLVICGTLLLVIPVVLSAAKDSDNKDDMTGVDNSQYEAHLQSLLPPYSLEAIFTNDTLDTNVTTNTTMTNLSSTNASTIDTNYNNNNPQRLAYDWMMKDPYLGDYADFRLQQRFALATFYYSFGGPDWDNDNDSSSNNTTLYADGTNATAANHANANSTNNNWLNYEISECDWEPRPTDNESTHMTTTSATIQTTDDNVCNANGNIKTLRASNYPGFSSGAMPPELAMLSQLQTLQFQNLSISFQALLPLDFNFSSQYPPSLHQLQCHQCVPIMDSQDNNDYSNDNLPSLDNFIPSELGLWTNLYTLMLRDSQTTGSIPTDVGRLSRLVSLDLSGNQLTGSLPSELALLSDLQYLNLANNSQLETGVTPEWCDRQNQNWELLDLGWCRGKAECCSS